VNWRTGGMSDPIDLTASVDPVWVLDCDAGNVLITNDVESPRLEGDFHVRERGWEILRAPWYDTDAPLALACSYAGVSSGELLSDRDDVGRNVNDELIVARLVLGVEEREELRELGSLVGIALGAGIESWRPGVTSDFDAAAVITAILEASGATPVCLIVGGDDRLRSFRHPLAVGQVLNDAIMAVVVAKRAGLHVAATRICVRRGDDEIVALMKTLGAVNDAVLEASLPGGTWGDSADALAAGYESVGQPNAWREHFQGGPIGFDQREFELAPFQTSSPFWNVPRQLNTAVAWNPSLRGGAKIEETYLLGEEIELLTATPSWPLVERPHGFKRSALKVLS
jgi:Xaa-Pro aminopeptidase